MGCLISAGADKGSFEFEKAAMFEHFSAHAKLLHKNYGFEDISFSVIPLNGYTNGDALIEACSEYIYKQDFKFPISLVKKNEAQNFYKGLQFKTYIKVKGETVEIGDGGLADWTQKLLENKKERLFTSGIGIQLLHYLS